MLKHKAPSRTVDFSRRAVDRAVLRSGIFHGLTLYPVAAGIPCILAGLLFHSFITGAAGLAACLFSLGNLVITVFFRNETIARRYIENLTKKLSQEKDALLSSLERNLDQCSAVDESGHLARQGKEQFRSIRIKFENVQELLEQKLSRGEMTFGRFMGAAEQVYLGALDNLVQVASILKSASSIDLAYIRENLGKLAAKNNLSSSEKKECQAMEKRLTLWDSQIRKVEDLLAGNEEAMTRLEEATEAIAGLSTGTAFSVTDLETAMGQLQSLARNADRYNSHHGGDLC